ncbi:MAG TPA: pirin family protein [Methylomirabilota bacterium]|nr:pirin family protein [Methylomirabilota bacterium]
MLQIIKAADRYHADHGWLSTYHHFSFADYYDPDNLSFGPLRVFNDDTVQPASGFPPHGHRDMEIVSYVLEGMLEHQDNQGNRGQIHAGEVQVMSAGTGTVHAEYNPSKTDPVHFLQIWIMPRARGLKPRWEQQQFTAAQRLNTLLPVVTPTDGSAVGPSRLQIDQDATVSVASLEQWRTLTHPVGPGRRAYFYAISGALEVNGTALAPGDQARITDTRELVVGAREPAELILIDLP